MILRTDIINDLISLTGTQSYLEIGSCHRDCFKDIKCVTKHDIEPDPGPNMTPTYRMTSDTAFSLMPSSNKYGVIFIDGLHQCDQVARDVVNATQHLEPNGFIVLHDCLPTQESEQTREFNGGSWTGDVWKFQAWMVKNFNNVWTAKDNWGCGIIWGCNYFDLPTLTDLSKVTWEEFERDWPWILKIADWEDLKKIITLKYKDGL